MLMLLIIFGLSMLMKDDCLGRTMSDGKATVVEVLVFEVFEVVVEESDVDDKVLEVEVDDEDVLEEVDVVLEDLAITEVLIRIQQTRAVM